MTPELRKRLVCPLCRGELEDRPRGLACRPCQRLFPVVDGVPWLVPEHARKLAREAAP